MTRSILLELVDYSDKAVLARLAGYRRGGVGAVAARQVFERFPGAWQVRQLAENVGATTFWHAAIPVEFREEMVEGRPVQYFSIED